MKTALFEVGGDEAGWGVIQFGQEVNTRTYTQIHTPTVVQGEGAWMEPFPGDFDMLQYFEMMLPLMETFDLFNKTRYILWVVAPLEVCDVTNNGRHLGF